MLNETNKTKKLGKKKKYFLHVLVNPELKNEVSIPSTLSPAMLTWS